MSTAKTLIEFSEPLKREFKSVCAARGRSMRAEIERLMKTEIQRFRKRKARK